MKSMAALAVLPRGPSQLGSRLGIGRGAAVWPAAIVLAAHAALLVLLWQATARQNTDAPAAGTALPDSALVIVRALLLPATAATQPSPPALPAAARTSMAPPAPQPLAPPRVEVTQADPPRPLPALAAAESVASTAQPAAPGVTAAAPSPAMMRTEAPSPAPAGPMPAQAAAPAAPAPAPTRMAADRRDCDRVPYPAALRERGIEGELRLRVLVTAEGRAGAVQLLAGSGWRLFDEAALAQARGCRFVPAMLDGKAVDSWVEFPVRFALAS
jgi:periplasmic protein TonB